MKKLLSCIFVVVLSLSLFAENRNALLIANSNYKTLGNLATPVNEAKALQKSLEKVGFTVTVIENGSREKMMDSLYEFQKTLEKKGGLGFFHYGGHAVQVNGKNYLIPVDADIPDERKVSSRTIDFDEVLISMQADTNIVILDACRNNPLPVSSGRSATRGLAIVTTKPKNSIIVFSAESGKVAQDGVFTPILTEKLLEPKTFTEILMDVRREVLKRTNMEQNPEETGRLTENIYLAGSTIDTSQKIEKKVTEINTNTIGIDYATLGKNAYENEDYALAFGYFSKADKITGFSSLLIDSTYICNNPNKASPSSSILFIFFGFILSFIDKIIF